jgi:dihydroxyacetone kinase-like predicted kinase
MNPSVGDIASAIDHAPSNDVIVLPNNGDAIPSARQACDLAGTRRAVVVETFDLAHGVTTMLAFGDARDFDANVAQMRQAASVAATASVIVAARDATTPAGRVRAGQCLVRVGRSIVSVADDAVAGVVAAARILDEESPVEVVTVFAGSDATSGECERIEAALRDEFVGADVEVRNGGQPVERYLLAVE